MWTETGMFVQNESHPENKFLIARKKEKKNHNYLKRFIVKDTTMFQLLFNIRTTGNEIRVIA